MKKYIKNECIESIKKQNDIAINLQLKIKQNNYNEYIFLTKKRKNYIYQIGLITLGLLCELLFIIFCFLKFLKIHLNLKKNDDISICFFLMLFTLFDLLFSTILFFISKNKKYSNLTMLIFCYIWLFKFFLLINNNVFKELKKINLEMKNIKLNLFISYKKNELFYISLIGIFLSIFLLLKFIFSFIKIFGGWSIEVDVMFYILILLLIDRVSYNLLFAILAPILALILNYGLLYPLQVFFEYILSYWVLIPIIFFSNYVMFVETKIFKNSQKIQKIIIILSFVFISLFLYLIKLFIHVWAGVIWWVNGNWIASFVLNSQIILGSFLICMPFVVISLLPIIKIRKLYFDINSKKFHQKLMKNM